LSPQIVVEKRQRSSVVLPWLRSVHLAGKVPKSNSAAFRVLAAGLLLTFRIAFHLESTPAGPLANATASLPLPQFPPGLAAPQGAGRSDGVPSQSTSAGVLRREWPSCARSATSTYTDPRAMLVGHPPNDERYDPLPTNQTALDWKCDTDASKQISSITSLATDSPTRGNPASARLPPMRDCAQESEFHAGAELQRKRSANEKAPTT